VADDRLELTPTQRRLHEALIEQREDLGGWYLAAIAVINDRELPDGLSLAAHALREVMEKLPGDEIQPDRAASLPEKVRNLETPWTKLREENQRLGGAWNGEITDALREFLTAMQAFFDGQEAMVKRRRQAAQQFMGGLQGTAGLPGGCTGKERGCLDEVQGILHQRLTSQDRQRERLPRTGRGL
jgi:hypothetical protein